VSNLCLSPSVLAIKNKAIKNKTGASKLRTMQGSADVATPAATVHVDPDSLSKAWRWAVALFLLMTADVASAASFYVSPTGSDTNSGSSSAPFRTIQKAASVVSAGSTVHVRPGIYQERVVTTKSGTSSQRIRYVSDTKWGAKIKPPAGRSGSDSMWMNSGHYVDIAGFELDGSTNDYFRTGIGSSGGFTRVSNNYVHDIVGTSPNAVGCCGGAGINLYGSGENDTRRQEAFGNVVARIGDIEKRYRPGDWVPIHGIYLSHPNLLAYNNIVYQIEANGIHLQHNPDNVIVSNNLSFKAGVGDGCAFYMGGYNGQRASNNIMQNNIAIDSAQDFCQNNAADSSNRWINNISWRNGTIGYRSGTHSGLINTDPRLANYKPDGTGDYHPTVGSPAIDRARWTSAPRTDFDGAIRPNGAGIDIGPYEYGRGN
jgi:Protein of unknown function (DUF1565)